MAQKILTYFMDGPFAAVIQADWKAFLKTWLRHGTVAQQSNFSPLMKVVAAVTPSNGLWTHES